MSDRKYQGKRKFDRAQLEYTVWCILTGVVDLVEGGLPTSIDYAERVKITDEENYLDLAPYERGALDGAGWALSIFFAQLTGEGIGVGDALETANNFYEAIENLVCKSWSNRGELVKQAIELRKEGFQIAEVLPDWPDCDKHAKAFVDAILHAQLDKVEQEIDVLCNDESCPFRKMDSAERVDMARQLDKFTPPGTITLSDGSYLEQPTSDAPEIRRRDEQGNFLDVRHPGDENYDEWAELFGFTPPASAYRTRRTKNVW